MIEASAGEERATRSYFDVHGTKDELPKVETRITTDYADRSSTLRTSASSGRDVELMSRCNHGGS